MRKWSLIWICLFVVFLVACKEEKEEVLKPEENDEDVEQNEPEEKEEEEEKIVEPEFTYPFTGLEADGEVTNRALAVMVNNHSAARPQTGLVDADMVYEFLAEGAITRFLAIYQSKIPEVVGPVRSARSYYIETAKAHEALYIYHGAAQFIEDDLRQGWVDNLNGSYYDDDRFLFKRESFRVMPHNSYVILENAYEVAKRNNIETEVYHQPWEFMSQQELADSNFQGDDINEVTVHYYDNLVVSYRYNQDTGLFTRYINGEVTADLNTDVPVELANILIYETEHRVIDDALRRFIDIESGGDGYLIQKGKIQKIEWKNIDGLMKPFINGEVAKLVPGKTWINVIPLSPGLTEAVSFN
ncbi:DUF3048 domain-containing protein [Bacillaceae bacterium W0354]